MEELSVPQHAKDLFDVLRRYMPTLRAQYAVRTLGVFGSAVRGEARADSDLDLLVAFDITPSLFTFIELEQHLSDLLGLRVDLVMEDALKPEIGRQILQEVITIEP